MFYPLYPNHTPQTYKVEMTNFLLKTKLYIPLIQSNLVTRPRLIQHLHHGLQLGHKLTLISAPAGFGKTTLVSSWINDFRLVIDDLRLDATPETPIANPQSVLSEVEVSTIANHVAWLSLDEGDNDLTRFLAYFIAALQTMAPQVGKEVLGMLQSPQPPPPAAILTALLNDITTIPERVVLVLDDYHLVDAPAVDQALTFLLEHLPPTMHLVITTREDPNLPLARLRARNQLTELRATELRFTLEEAAAFLNQVMDLNLAPENIAALESRTEGWIAGLQLAAISMRGHKEDTAQFIQSFTGSHHFVMDYLVEEVLSQQSESIQSFLLHTAILDRLCGPLCDAVWGDGAVSGQETLEYLQQANLFIVPLDNERRWYRYHRLFADLLRQRGQQQSDRVTECHLRASQWYEENGLEIEAFHHAAAASDIARAERLIEGKGMPLHFRGAVAPVLHWLRTLPTPILDAWPSLWTAYASVLLVTGQQSAAEQKLQAAAAALQNAPPDAKTRDLIGRVAAIRSTLAASRLQIETIITESQRALEYLHPDNLAFRTSTIWKLGYAYHLQGDRAAAREAYTQVITTGRVTGNTVFTTLAVIGLGTLQATDNQLHLAAASYRQSLELFGDQPLPSACEAHLGLARLFYEWNELAAAQQHGEQAWQLAQRIENNDRLVACELFLAQLKLAQGDVPGAAALLAQANELARQHQLAYRLPEVAAAQIFLLLHQDKVAAAAQIAQTYHLPLSQARVHLAQGDAAAALTVLQPLRQQAEAKGWADERLKVLVLQALAHQIQGNKEAAIQHLREALIMAEPGGFIRTFVDEGPAMMQLLSDAAARGVQPDYIGKLRAVWVAERPQVAASSSPLPQPLLEPLSERELEVLHLIAEGLSNHEISKRLFLALSTVKGHNRIIFDKLQVKRRTEAVARGRELGLLL